jgi:hypothetical protein
MLSAKDVREDSSLLTQRHAESESESTAWVCDRNSKCDLIDKLILHAFHFDALKVVLSIPPTYPSASSGNMYSVDTLNLNDIQARFMHAVNHGVATNDPCRVLTPSDFLCSARILHAELLRQANKVRNASRDDHSSQHNAFRLSSNTGGSQFPFTLEVALARLPVRLFVRNYGLPPPFRAVVTQQLLDQKHLNEEEICYEQRVLVHAVKNSRTSVDSLLRDSNAEVKGNKTYTHTSHLLD